MHLCQLRNNLQVFCSLKCQLRGIFFIVSPEACTICNTYSSGSIFFLIPSVTAFMVIGWVQPVSKTTLVSVQVPLFNLVQAFPFTTAVSSSFAVLALSAVASLLPNCFFLILFHIVELLPEVPVWIAYEPCSGCSA